jgi:nucleoside-diphosphate-sugar epimerase
MVYRKMHKKINMLVIGRGFVGHYLKNSSNQYFNITSLSSRQFSVKKKIINIDVLLHAIGLNYKKSLIDSKKAFLIKKEFTNKVIKFCRYNKIPKIIYISSIHVYKKHLIGNINERTKCINKDSYALAHIYAENILKKNSSSKLKVIIIRVANLFGINNNNKISLIPIINKIIKHLVLNKKLLIYNKFLLKDIVPMNYFIFIISKLILLNKKFQIINVGYKSYFLIDIVKIIISRIKKHSIYLPKLEIVEDNSLKESLNFKSLFLKKNNSQKFLIKEIDSSLKFLA